MLIDKNRYKELIKEDGNKLLKGGNAIVEIVSGTSIAKGKTCNLYVYSNGIYLDVTFGLKEYFDIKNLSAIEKYNTTLELRFRNQESISFKFSTQKGLLKTYNLFDCQLKAYSRHISLEESIKMEEELTKKQKELEKEIIRQKKLKDKEELKAAWNDVKTTINECPLKNKSVKDGNIVNDHVARCPKCGSTSIAANKKGFSLAKGALGVATVGAYGVVAAGHGKNKVLVTCLNCGKQWKPGK
jgi:ferredoxin-like protein FixX